MVMTTFKDFVVKFREYFKFSKEEIEACAIAVFIMAFIVSFNRWGDVAFDFWAGLANLFVAILVVAFVFGVQLTAIKIQALQWGFRTEFKIWWYGLLFGLIFVFATAPVFKALGATALSGGLWLLLPGGIFFHHLAPHRLGWFRYGVNMTETGLSCLMGILGAAVTAILFKIILISSPSNYPAWLGLRVSVLLMVYNALPIPPLIGSRMFFWSRPTFFFLMPSIVLGGILFWWVPVTTFLGALIMLLISLIFGAAFWYLMLLKIEGYSK